MPFDGTRRVSRTGSPSLRSPWFPVGRRPGSALRFQDYAVDPAKLAVIERSRESARRRRLDDHDDLLREVASRCWSALSARRVTMPELEPTPARLIRLLASPRLDLGFAAEVLSADQVLSETLRWVALGHQERSGHRGDGGLLEVLEVLGPRRASNLVLAHSLRAKIYTGRPQHVLDELWYGALGCAVASSMITQARGKRPEKAFLLGLVHDAGRPVVVSLVGSVLEHLGRSDSMDMVGPPVVHLLHARVGALLARSWGLEACFIAGTAYHHDPSPPPKARNAARVLRFASLIHQRMLAGDPPLEIDSGVLSHSLMKELGLERASLAPLLALHQGALRALASIPGLD
jgi:HD-like signal output (HDOD) protein